MSVFANSMEISSKSMGGKSICQFPDVCFTPPQTPATPMGVPIPYPNTGMAGDTTDGSTSVKIGGEQVMLKNKSSFKQSMGDEAGAAPKKGLINSKTKGKVFFIAWSMDVKFEGENVVRNLDLTTHNHGSGPNSPAPATHIAKAMKAKFDNCDKDAEAIKSSCRGKKRDFCPGVLNMSIDDLRDEADPKRTAKRADAVAKHADRIAKKSKIPAKVAENKDAARSEAAGAVAEAEADSNACVKKMRCFLRPYGEKERDGKAGCCPGQTPHHIPPEATVKHLAGYERDKALCVCLEGTNQSAGSHGKNHAAIDYLSDKKLEGPPKKSKLTLNESIQISAAAVAVQCGCDAKCIEEQLKKETFKNNDLEEEVNHKSVTSLEAKNKSALDKKLDRLEQDDI